MSDLDLSCHAPRDTPPLSREAALERLLGLVQPLGETERVTLEQGLGRVLAAPLVSPIDVPGWDNSAMDGYAVRTEDLGSGPTRLRVSQRVAAGHAAQPLEPATAARIFTGAPVPPGADTVIAQEQCRQDGDWVELPAQVRPGSHIRRAGEDIRAGSQPLAAGIRLGPQHLGLAAAVGVAELSVWRPLRVAMLATGDELAMPGEPLGPGKIYNSNRFVLSALLRALGCEVLDLGIVADTLAATLAALEQGARAADLVVASGGVSVGEEDHVRAAVQRLGSLDLWRVAVRPGKPVAFGRIGVTPFLGHPGNPLSLFVAFCLFARPLVQRMQGIAGVPAAPTRLVRAGFDWPRPDPRREYRPAHLAPGAGGEPEAQVHPSRSAAALSPLVWANGLVEIPEGRTLRRGDPVVFLPFDALLH